MWSQSRIFAQNRGDVLIWLVTIFADTYECSHCTHPPYIQAHSIRNYQFYSHTDAGQMGMSNRQWHIRWYLQRKGQD